MQAICQQGTLEVCLIGAVDRLAAGSIEEVGRLSPEPPCELPFKKQYANRIAVHQPQGTMAPMLF